MTDPSTPDPSVPDPVGAEVERLTRAPHLQAVGGEPADDDERGDELLRRACLTYGADDPARPRAALELLGAHPHLGGLTLHTAAATGDVAAARRHLAADPGGVDRDGGPFAWPPLLYATYSRIDDPAAGRDTVGVAALLLDGGADPDAGYLWEGLVPPFTALTGAFGGGEQGQPPHPRALELATLLLDHGADADDGQTVYDRGLGDVARDDTDWLALLLDHGFGRGDGGPWRARLGERQATPEAMAAEVLHHAAENGLVARVRLLLDHGVDPDRGGDHPALGGRTPYQGAVRFGYGEVAGLLARAGADVTSATEADRAVGAFVAGDRAALDALPDGVVAEVRAAHPDLIARAAERGRPEGMALMVDHGFAVDHLARVTALHEAAYRGDRVVVDVLLALGADPTTTEPTHGATPAAWARYAGHEALAARLDSAGAGAAAGT